jgi:hypothetical protein
MQEIPFIPSGDTIVRYPLKRYLPPFHAGVVSTWLRENSESGCNVLDPLGSNPLYTLEAADAGFRVFQAQKNPALRLMTEVLSRCYGEADFTNAIHILLDQEWHGEKLEKHIQNLYQTDCRKCGQPVMAEGFVWKKGAAEPTSVVLMCPHCGESGAFPVNENDLIRLHQTGNIAVYRSRALQRCILEEIDIKKSIEYALSCYTPRALHVIVILFNTLDGLTVSQEERSLIAAVLLEVFDHATSLWHWPSREFRPHQLSVPSLYFEKNIYQSIFQAIRTWTDYKKPCVVESYPVIPDHAHSICLFERKTTIELFSKQTDPKLCQFFCIFPRPNQAFWTFSAVWSAWLFGKKAAEGMLAALSRQRYGWYWFAQAISTTFSSIKNEITENERIFGICSDFTPSYLLAVLLGACDAGFQLAGCAFQNNTNILQFNWQYSSKTNEEKAHRQIETTQQHLIRYLTRRAEPASFRELFSVYSTTLAINTAFPPPLESESTDYYNKILSDLQNELADRKIYSQYSGASISSTKWTLVNQGKMDQALDDQIEHVIVDAIYQQPKLDFYDLYVRLCQNFRGFLTPDREYSKACLESYASRINLNTQFYVLDADEDPQKRLRERDEIAELIGQIGKKLGAVIQTGDCISWIDTNGQPIYQFFISTTASFSEFIKANEHKRNGIPVLVFPASRSRLIQLKIERNPRLKEILEKDWHLVKFRHIRKISEQEQFTLQAWQDILDVDPPLWEPPAQLKFL